MTCRAATLDATIALASRCHGRSVVWIPSVLVNGREDCERLHQEIDHVADDEQLHRTHLRFPPAGEKVAGEEPGPRDQRSKGREHPAIDVRERLECLLGEMLQRVVVMAGRFAARGAISAGQISATGDTA